MSNEVWTVHLKGQLLSQSSGERKGKVYVARGSAVAAMSRLVKAGIDPANLEVVRYTPSLEEEAEALVAGIEDGSTDTDDLIRFAAKVAGRKA